MPTEPRLLSTGSPTKDEDPSVLRARDGTMFVAWFSDRGGNADIYVTSTANGNDWTAPVRVTTHAGGDFNPHLVQDDQGTFHLVWFRWEALFRGNIRYNSSRDGRTWDPATEVAVTTEAGGAGHVLAVAIIQRLVLIRHDQDVIGPRNVRHDGCHGPGIGTPDWHLSEMRCLPHQA